MKKTTGFMAMADRYRFDFNTCKAEKGWAQLDTRQDASYYGDWVNPITLETVCYCEGDVTHIKYDSETEFKEGLMDIIKWHADHEYAPKIDGMCQDDIIAAFKRLGFEEYLH